MVYYSKVCENCGKTYSAHTKERRFCCKKCSTVSRVKTPLPNKICANIECKKEFTPRIFSQKYCSLKCVKINYKAHKTTLDKNDPVKKRCLWCQGEFLPFRIDTLNPCIYCSNECGGFYRAMVSKIQNKYFFERAKMRVELDRLKIEGQNYRLED
jgi:hypothetical protein